MISLLLAVALTQTAPTRAQTVGAINTLVAAYQDRANRTITRNASFTRTCAGPASGKNLTGRTTIRFGALIMSEAAQTALGMASPNGEAYGAAEIQIDPDQPTNRLIASRATLNAIFDVMPAEVEVRASPLIASEACIVRRDAPEIASAALYRCACAATPSTCTWDPDGAGTTSVNPAPTGTTFAPGTWSGAGCKRKPCVTRFDGAGIDHSWPSECAR
jgi:hypothetical protein